MEELKIKQLVVAHWGDAKKIDYTLYAVDLEGNLGAYDRINKKWLKGNTEKEGKELKSLKD